MYLIASPATRKAHADLTVLFERRNRGEVEDHFYGFDRGVSVSIAADGSSARVLARLGRYGRIRPELHPPGADTPSRRSVRAPWWASTSAG